MRKLEYLFDENDYEKGIFFNIGNSRSGHNFIKEMILSWTSDENHKLRKYINLENRPPSMFNEFVKNISLSPTSICVLITRDLLNWFTSISYFMINNIERSKRYNCKLSEQNLIHVSDIKNKTEIEKDPNKVIIPDSISKTQYLINIKNKEKNIPLKLNKALDSWLQIAKEFCGITNYLSAQFIKIYYDTFFSDKSYRKNICNTIGGTYSEKKINFVPAMGNYSTFDKDKFQGNAQQMKVLERFKQWNPEHYKYLKVLKQHSAFNFYLNNFNISKEKQEFINNI